MLEITVHARLRKCCRKQLRKLDKARAALQPKPPSLEEEFGDLTVDMVGKKLSEILSGPTPGALGPRIAVLCHALCKEHAEVHENEGAMAEADIWRLRQHNSFNMKDTVG